MYDNLIQEGELTRKPATISLPEDLAQETGRFCRAHSVTLSHVAREAIRDYLYKQELASARRSFSAHAHRQGVLTEQELLKKLAR
jgi:metal-responsive CopG/Arc/MetJ family transcriptional regulator